MNKNRSKINNNNFINRSISDTQYFLATIVSVCITMLYINYMNYALDNLGVLDRRYWRSLTIYITGILIFLGVFFALLIIAQIINSVINKSTINHKSVFNIELSKSAQIIIVSVGYITGMYFILQYMFRVQLGETGFNEGNFYNIPVWLWVIFGGICTLSVLYFLLTGKDIDSFVKKFSYVLSIIICFAPLLIFNPFVEGNFSQGYYTSQFVNFNAVWETIYNVLDGVPYTLDTTGLYGHYSLFFLIPLKLVGPTQYITVISIVFAFFAAIQQSAMVYIINSFSPKNWIACILSIASTIRLTHYSIQISPIRTLFPILLFGFFVKLYNERDDILKKKNIALAIVILVFSTLCNVEIAAACMIGYVVYIFIDIIAIKNSIKNLIFRLITACCVVASSTLIAIAIVDCYNLICGGPLIFRTFFFPLIGGDTSMVNYIQDHFNWPVPLGNYAWEYVLLVFLCTFCASWILANKRDNKDLNGLSPVIGGTAAMAIIAFVYYMNEPLWTDLAIYKLMVYGVFSIVIGKNYELIDRSVKSSYLWQQAMRIICLLIISIAVIGGVQIINDPARIAARKWSGAYNSEILQQQFAQVDIPKDTYGIGQGITMMYHALGMKNHPQYRDSSAFIIPYSPTFEKVVSELRENNTVFIGTTNPFDLILINNLQERGFSFSTIETYQIGSWEYSYCYVTYSGD